MTALRTQYVNISEHFDNADGTLTVTAIARRSGTMRYRSDTGDRVEFVPPEMIDARDNQGRPVMGMLAGAPNTNEHPAQIIRYDADSRKAVQVGRVNEEIHIFNDADGERSVKVRFDVHDPGTIEDIRSGRKRGVSLGYLVNVIREDGEYKGVRYTHRQAMPFSIDHLAIVANPRNPGALITRFDSDDVGVMAVEDVRSAIEVVRVDACCAACDGNGKPGCSDNIEPDEPKPKKKKVKTDAEDEVLVSIVFKEGTHSVDIPTATALWQEGTIDRVRMDGIDHFMAANIALALADEGLIHEDAFVPKAGVAKGGGKCGRGWVGVKGSCKRMTKGGDRTSAQKSALKEFAQGQRVKNSARNGESSRTKKPVVQKSSAPKVKLSKTQVEGKVLEHYKVNSINDLKKNGQFRMATSGLGKLDLKKKSDLERVYRKTIGILPGEDSETGRGAINGINILKYDMPWKAFGLDPKTATDDDIKKAYRDLSKKYHPDRPGGDAEVFDKINTFYKSLTEKFDSRNDGISSGACGPGWEGTKGNCRRKKRNLGSIARKVGAAALVAGGVAYAAKNPRKTAALGVAAVGAAALLRRNAEKRKAIERDRAVALMRHQLQKKRGETVDRMKDDTRLASKKALKSEQTRRRRLSSETLADLAGKKEDIEQSPVRGKAKSRLQAIAASQDRIRREKARLKN
jgi:Uncharacterized protein conserved in bacteria (DUF2213)/DnaJ domain